MGLDWILQAKHENGRTVEPGETADEKPASISDPETVRQFRAYYDEVITEIDDPGPEPAPPPGPTGLGFIIDVISGSAAKRKRIFSEELEDWEHQKRTYDDWNRPFEELLDEYVSYGPPVVPPENRDALPKIIVEVGGFYDLRGNVLRDDQNDVSRFASEVLKMNFPLFIYGDMSAEEMLELADNLEKALVAYRASDQEQVEEDIEAVEAAIPWLRFWGAKGHSIVADF